MAATGTGGPCTCGRCPSYVARGADRKHSARSRPVAGAPPSKVLSACCVMRLKLSAHAQLAGCMWSA
eukprot:3495082-Alexandrium_andersonii.AAC.1